MPAVAVKGQSLGGAARLQTGGRAMNEILFVVEEADDGSYRASAVGAAIHTEADNLVDLHR